MQITKDSIKIFYKQVQILDQALPPVNREDSTRYSSFSCLPTTFSVCILLDGYLTNKLSLASRAQWPLSRHYAINKNINFHSLSLKYILKIKSSSNILVLNYIHGITFISTNTKIFRCVKTILLNKAISGRKKCPHRMYSQISSPLQ